MPDDVYAMVLRGLAGQDWSTAYDLAGRIGLPWAMVQNTLTELVGDGLVDVRADAKSLLYHEPAA